MSSTEEWCVSFGYKCAWLAIQSPAAEIAEKLLGADAERVGWQDGVDAAYGGSIFVSPTVEGWTFVVSTQFLEDAGSPETLRKRVGQGAQFFASDRVSGVNVAVDGKGKRTKLGSEDAVMELAERWSVNPQKLLALPSSGEQGWVADRLAR